jgi:hypothetical protein
MNPLLRNVVGETWKSCSGKDTLCVVLCPLAPLLDDQFYNLHFGLKCADNLLVRD